MSGIFIARYNGTMEDLSKRAEQLKFTEWTQSKVFRAAGFSCGFTWIGPKDFVPWMRDEDCGVTICMLGRLYDSKSDRRLDRSFNNIVLQYRERGPDALTGFNGGGAVVLFDEKNDRCFIVTDRFLFFPLFIAGENDRHRAAVCSHSDVLADSMDSPPHTDDFWMACYISKGTCQHPYTLYKEIKFLEPATVYEWDSDGIRKYKTHWNPQIDLDPSRTIEELGEELAFAIKRAVNMRIDEAGGKSAILLSGGLDSRAFIYSTPTPRTNLAGLTFYEAENYEFRIARKVAARARVEHVCLQRNPDYYADAMPEALRISGCLWDCSHAHSAGFSKDIHDQGFSLVISGYFIDMLLKGWAIDARWEERGRYLPPKRVLAPFGSFLNVWGTSLELPKKEVEDEINRRMFGLFEGINVERLNDEDRLLVELALFRPATQMPMLPEATVPWRTMPFDLISVDNRLVDLFQKIPPEMKLNSAVFIEAMKRISWKSLKIPYADIGVSIAAPRAIQNLQGMAHARAMRRQEKRNIPQGSWDKWCDMMKRSKKMRSYFDEYGERCAELVADLTGIDIRERPYKHWAAFETRAKFYRRALSLVLWRENRVNSSH